MWHKNTITQHKLSSKVAFNKWVFILHFACLIVQAPQVWFRIGGPLNWFWNHVFQAQFSQSGALHQDDFFKMQNLPISARILLQTLLFDSAFYYFISIPCYEKLLKPFWLPWQLKWNFYKDNTFKAKYLVDTMNVMTEIIFQETSLAYWLHLKFIAESG